MQRTGPGFRTRGAAWATLLCLMLSLFWAAAPVRAAPGISLTLSATEVTLEQGGSTKGLLMVENAANTAVEVDLSATASNEALSVSGPTPAKVTVPGGGSRVVEFEVTRTAAAPTQGLMVNFVAQSETTGTMTTLAVSVGPPLGDVLKAEFATAEGSGATSVSDFRPLSSTLVISNAGAVPLTVTSVDVAHIAGVEPPSLDLALPSTLTPGSQLAVEVPVAVDPDAQPTPGPRSVTATVVASSGDGQTVSRVATESIEIIVFGESDILKMLGVPVFLLLPGLLILVVSVFLISKATPWRSRISEDTALTGNLPRVAVMSVAISLAFGWIYPSLTAIYPGQRRDYLRFQSFEDFYWVFLWSFLIAIGIWLVALLASLAKPLWLHEFGYEVGDEPAAVLRKALNRHLFGGRLHFPLVEVPDAGNGVTLRAPTPAESHFVSPRLVLTPEGSEGTQVVADVKESIWEASSQGEKLNRFQLCKRIRDEQKVGHIVVTYREGDIPTPTVAASITPLAAIPTCLIFFEG